MRPIQEIFDLMISTTLYREDGPAWMCYSLARGYLRELITKEECDYAINEISNYIGYHLTLGVALLANNLPYEFEDKKAIYSNWDNRPVINIRNG